MQFIDLQTQRVRIEEKLQRRVAHVIENGHYILGPEVAEFEAALADYIGVKHVIACANGTDALYLPLLAHSIGVGDAVFCPTFTFAATAEVIALAGAEPVFVDIEQDSYNMNTTQLVAAIEAIKKEGRLKPKAIIAVDLFGLAADYEALTKIANDYGLLLIEDAAQAMGGHFNKKMCGSFGQVAGTSFYPAKPLGCYGDGGAMFTNDDALAQKLRSLAFHGKGESQYDNIYIGLNSRLDTLQAAILLEKLAILDDEIAKRNVIALGYTEGLTPFVKTPICREGAYSAYAQYTIQTQKRDALKEFLAQRSIPTMIYYVKPLHLQKAYSKFPIAPGGLAVSESLSHTVLSLPMHPYLSREDQELIINSVAEFFVSQ